MWINLLQKAYSYCLILLTENLVLMLEITVTEFRNHFGKYLKLAEKEKIGVTKRGKPCFTIVPAKDSKVEVFKSLFGILPSNASIGIDSKERS